MTAKPTPPGALPYELGNGPAPADKQQPAMADGGIPESLRHPGLAELWDAIRRALDRRGPAWRGAIALPDLDRPSDLSLASLVGRKPPRRLDLAEIEAALVQRNIGGDLCDAITSLGHPPSTAATGRRKTQARTRAARAALGEAAESWEEPWATDWAGEMQRSGTMAGLDGEAAAQLAADVRRLLDHLDSEAAQGASRTEVAASLFGSAHALDRGRKLAAAVEIALRRRCGQPGTDGRELWEAAGIQADSVSAPALTWALPATGTSPLDQMIRAATSGAVPAHITLMALRKHPIRVPEGAPVLVVENPRPVEAAAERKLSGCVIATNGNPTTAPLVLIRQLLNSGARLLYHGDFDAAGLSICRRMRDNGCQPWKMGASDYESAVEMADQSDVRLEQEPRDCGNTPWDPALQESFNRRRLIIHEEFVLDPLLDQFDALALAD